MFNLFKKTTQKQRDIFATTNIGYVRELNEDSYLVINETDTPYSFVAVADGMGGHEGGLIVSRHVVDNIHKTWQDHIANNKNLSHCEVETIITNSLNSSNQWIHTIYTKLNLDSPMGTTFTGILIGKEYVTLFHVGDSRLYIGNKNNTIQISEDHTWVREQIKKGLLSEKDAAIHPARSILNNCVGARAKLILEKKRLIYYPKTHYLLSTDGLHGNISLSFIHRTLFHDNPNNALNSLMRKSLIEGGRDNLTGIIVYT